ncbi:hypothetical protein CR513_15443, partial [Mucuna pruriens]
MVAKVLITNIFELDKGLGRRLDDIADPVALQENPGRSELGYSGAARKAKLGKSNRQDEGEETEEEALKELERLLEQERPKLQSRTEELEIINLGKGEETKEIRIGKLIPPDFK